MIASFRPPLQAIAAAFLFAIPPFVHASEIYVTEGVAINGYDPVTYFKEQKPVKGSAKFKASYQGADFQFSSRENQDAFVRNPERFAPQYGGYCAYGLARGYKATTEPQAFTIVDDKLYLNYNDEIMATWRGDPAGYIRRADANWGRVKDHPAP